MKNNKTLLIVILILSIGVFFSGCGKKEETSSGEKKEDVKTEEPGKTTEGTKSNELGIMEGMPKDYPSDVPQPKNAKCMGSLNTSEGTVVTFESTDKPKDVLAEFTTELEKNGYKKSEGEMMGENGGLAMWTKDKKEVSLMLAWDKEKNTSSVVVTYK
jgi:hypothetical protein